VRPKKFKKFTRLLVSWCDIVSDSTWHNKKAVDEFNIAKVKTLGFFLDNNKCQLRIAHSVAEGGDCDITVIPYGCITKIKEI